MYLLLKPSNQTCTYCLNTSNDNVLIAEIYQTKHVLLLFPLNHTCAYA